MSLIMVVLKSDTFDRKVSQCDICQKCHISKITIMHYIFILVTKVTLVTLLFTFVLICDLSWNFWVFYFCEISIFLYKMQRWKKASQTSLLSPKVRMSLIMVVLKSDTFDIKVSQSDICQKCHISKITIIHYIFTLVTKVTFVTLLFTFVHICDLSWNFWVFYFLWNFNLSI